ncbi:MAG TPA: hemerythrin domain-containing protein [Rhodocyclaceae bacterium]
MDESAVFLVEEDPAERNAIGSVLHGHGLRVESFVAADGFLAACDGERRGCAVIGLHRPIMEGLQVQQDMSQRGILLPVIFLAEKPEPAAVVRAIKGGAVDFLSWPASADAILTSVRSAIDADARKRQEIKSRKEAISRLMQLTTRERHVMHLAIQGKSNKEIARRLGISHRTIEIHKAHIMAKTGASHLVELLEIARAAQPAQAGADNRAAPPADGAPDDDPALCLHWSPACACGEDSLDAQHRRLFDLANVLLRAALDITAGKPEFDAAFEALLSQVLDHFGHEEQLLRSRGYEDLERHSAQHRRLIAIAMRLRAHADEGKIPLGALVDFLLSELVAGHMLEEDRKFHALFSDDR